MSRAYVAKGWSDRVEGRYDPGPFLPQLDDAVAAHDPLHVVGTSMGGLIAMAYATRDDVSKLVSLTLIGPACLTGRNQFGARLLAIDPLARVMGKFVGHSALGTPIEHLDTVREPHRPNECHVVTDCGHMIPFEDPHGTARLLSAFFQQITGGRPT